jgi:hypothetical protein
VYNLIIDHDVIVNARFAFLSVGRCPMVAAPANCWSHPGSYIGEVGVVTSSGDRLVVRSGNWSSGFEYVTVNDVTLSVGHHVTGRAVIAELTSAFALRLRAGNFELSMQNSDRFINLLEVRAIDWSKLSSHGLLGQTWRTGRPNGRDVPEVEGWIDDYAEADNDLLGTHFLYQPQPHHNRAE